MRTDTTRTFEVSAVKRAKKPLPEVPYKQAVETLLKVANPEHRRWALEDWTGQRSSIGITEAQAYRPVEACARYHGRLLADVRFHPVVAAAHDAFMDHRPLILSPDILWLMICQAVANHVKVHAEELRPRLVRHSGVIEIVVRRDDFVKGSPENPWTEVLDEFSTRVRDHVGPAIDLFLPAFSTTGPTERAAAGIVLLDAVQSYFQYSTGTWCGIPAITLEGTPEDWQALADRAEGFAEFGLEGWIEVLRPILRQFVRASRGDVETRFWRSLYKFEGISGLPLITGWITAFFPYLKDRSTGLASHQVEWFFGSDRGPLKRTLYPPKKRDRSRPLSFDYTPTISSLPSGLSQVPFRWNYLDKTFAMEFLGGFVGVAQDEGSLALRPEIGWAVRDVAKTS